MMGYWGFFSFPSPFSVGTMYNKSLMVFWNISWYFLLEYPIIFLLFPNPTNNASLTQEKQVRESHSWHFFKLRYKNKATDLEVKVFCQNQLFLVLQSLFWEKKMINGKVKNLECWKGWVEIIYPAPPKVDWDFGVSDQAWVNLWIQE